MQGINIFFLRGGGSELYFREFYYVNLVNLIFFQGGGGPSSFLSGPL